MCGGTKSVTEKTAEAVAWGEAKNTGGTLQNTASSILNPFCKVAGFFASGGGSVVGSDPVSCLFKNSLPDGFGNKIIQGHLVFHCQQSR